MTNNKPFIKKFTDAGFYYIYDVNTNQVVEVEKPVFDIIEDYDETGAAGLESKNKESLEEIKNARKNYGLFSNFRPKAITMGIRTAEDIEKHHHKTGLKQLILETSRTCNLDCKYCRTSGKYAGPGAQTDTMSRETCFKAIDFFFERANHTETSFITFYGGEPLLQFDLMREAVAYAKQRFGTHSYSFNLTTNGTLMDKKRLDFLVENDFTVLVSLDGPQKINDRYRQFKNGKGTYNRIMKNLEFLKTYNLDFYTRKVSISGVLAPPFDQIGETLDFFTNESAMKEMKGKVRAALVNTQGTTFLEDYGLEERMKEYPNVSRLFLERFKKMIIEDRLAEITIEKQQYFQILYNLARRPIDKLYEYVIPLGTCHIGLRRVFVNTTGDFYVCERVDDSYKIGNIDSGFDYERISYFYRKLEEVYYECRNCWAISYCDRCWASIGKIEEFTGTEKETFCSYSKTIIEKAMKVYTQLLRENPDSLNVFKDVMVK